MESSIKRFRLGKVYQKFIVLEILKYAGFKKVMLRLLTDLSQASRKYALENYIYIKRVLTG